MEYPRYPDLLCLGAQKSATTWLYQVLKRNPRVVVPPIKELHYFSQLHEKGASKYGPKHREEQVAGIHRWLDSSPQHAARMSKTFLARIDRAAERAVDDFWYASFFETANDRKRCVDICPGYFNMPEPGVAHAVTLLPERSQYLILVRDPVDRALSHIRMHVSRGMEPSDLTSLATAEAMPQTYMFFSDYRVAISRWEKFAGAERVHLALYDDILADPGAALARIYGLMRLDPPPAGPATFERVFKGDEIDIPPVLRTRLLAELAPQYDFLATRFPDTVAKWRARHEVLAAAP